MLSNTTHSRVGFPIRLLFVACLFLCGVCRTEKVRYASSVECDRYSMDAVYFEKFLPITDSIFAGSTEFVNRITDLIVDNFLELMADLPGRDGSDIQEKKVLTAFNTLKKAFLSKAKLSQRNVTSAWEALVASNFDLLMDNGKSSLADFLNKTNRVADAYTVALSSMDFGLGGVVGFTKATVRNGLSGIVSAAQADLDSKRDEDLRNGSDEGVAEDPAESHEERLRKKKLEIAGMVAPGFLGAVTVRVLEKEVDLFKKVTTDADGRDSPFDDVMFDIALIRNRIRSIIRSDLPKDKGSIDLARRSIYTYFAELSHEMYSSRMKDPTGWLNQYKESWENEEKLADALVQLMEVHP